MSSEIIIPFSRKNPFPARLKEHQRLTTTDSAKKTDHYELCLAGSGLQYEVGDSLGVFPSNDPLLVEEMLKRLGFSGEEMVPTPQGILLPIREALMHHYVITQPSKQFLAALAQKDPAAEHFLEMTQAAAKPHLEEYLWGREVIDPLLEHPQATFAPEEFVQLLRKLQPRLYSIASSPKLYPEEIHLTVATVEYETHGRARKGVCSTFLADRVTNETTVPVFIHSAKHFRMPEDIATPIIMVGPGTGIAPFRAFLQDRKATGGAGKQWLFFGEQRAASDFLYQEELEQMLREGTLHRLDTAFSRDQAEKIYVQHRMLEQSHELFAWLEAGAYFYVCGDASRMAKDVEAALIKVVEVGGGKTVEQATEYVAAMKKEKRYRKDVY